MAHKKSNIVTYIPYVYHTIPNYLTVLNILYIMGEAKKLLINKQKEGTITQSEETPVETETVAKTAEEEANAYYEAGLTYLYGLEGQEINLEAAYTNFEHALEKAADLGDAKAMYNIGYMYENGLGVKQDSAKAKEWFDKAEAAK